jgi:regulator of sirC expression with transglutaminase-like and TPR domain
MVSPEFVRTFTQFAKAPNPDLATVALLIAKLEYPTLDASPYLAQLDRMGEAAHQRVARFSNLNDPQEPIQALNTYLFDEQGFSGNEHTYDDPRNSYLNEVLTRRTGIPITLAMVYIEVARRAGVSLQGVNFPGHFLLRFQSKTATGGLGSEVIIDPFHGGAILSDTDCRNLLKKHVGHSVAFDKRLLVGATKSQILIRMLANLKRIYINMRSFPQGRAITELLLALNPSAMTELRDRGLLAYHLNDFSAALQDLESYLLFTSRNRTVTPNDEHAEIWEHVKTLRRRVASLN